MDGNILSKCYPWKKWWVVFSSVDVIHGWKVQIKTMDDAHGLLKQKCNMKGYESYFKFKSVSTKHMILLIIRQNSIKVDLNRKSAT